MRQKFMSDIMDLAKEELLLDRIITILYNKSSESCTPNEIGTFSDVIYYADDKVLNESGETIIDLTDGFINGRPQLDYGNDYLLAMDLVYPMLDIANSDKVVLVKD